MLNQAADPFGIIGQVLDSQFRVDRLVGEGGFSAVYRGHHLGLDEPIAIKCLKLPASLSQALVDQFARRFRDESRILYRLSQGNLNIVRSIAGGTWQSPYGLLVPFMVLEWMDGRSLANDFTIRRTVGKQGRPLPELLKVFESAADGIAYAHTQGVIHRDLNPGNFFFTNTPQGQRLKVLDFGVAKILDDSTLNIERNQTVGQIRIFAPAYGSPEQFDDALGKASAASDVYAFALILLEALRDRAVNDGQHLGEFAQKAIDPHVRPTPLSLGVDVPPEVESIFARATKLHPQERWQSVSEFWNALTHAASAATEQRYAQAATETPSLGMPSSADRSTKTGMAPPAQGKPPMKRMDKTVPVGAVMPQIPGLPPRQPPRAPMPPSAPRIEQAPVSPQVGASSFVHDEETKIGQIPQQTAIGVPSLGESEGDGDEVTRVGAPAADVLAGLQDQELRPARLGVTMTQVSQGNQNQPPPRPAAGQGPDPQSQQGYGAAPPPQQRPQQQMAGTLMMNPGGAGFGPLPGPPPGAPPQRPIQQQPQMPTTPGLGPQGAPPGYPQQMQQPPQVQMPPPGYGQPPPQQMQQPPPGYGQQPMPPPQQQQMPPGYGQQPQMDPSQQYAPPVSQGQPDASLAPEIPGTKKSSAMLFIGIGVGLVVLVGVAILVVVVASGPKTPQIASASAATSAAAPPPAPAPEPAPDTTAQNAPDTPPATPTPTEEADAGAVAANNPADPNNAAGANGGQPANNGGGQPVNNGGGQAWNGTPSFPTPAKSAASAAPVDPNAFNEASARSALAGANGVLAFCKKEGGITGPGSATVTFNPDGSVASVAMDSPYAGTPTGDCVKGQLQRVKAKPWQGSPQSVKDSFDIPK